MLKKLKKKSPWIVFGIIMYWLFFFAVLENAKIGDTVKSVMLVLFMISIIFAILIVGIGFFAQIGYEIKNVGKKEVLGKLLKNFVVGYITIVICNVVITVWEKKGIHVSLLADSLKLTFVILIGGYVGDFMFRNKEQNS
ncbi:MAG: hypothetical protein J6A75_08520 [Lachnospiraceae bacterium]|nr:hypothetical protein [Lachnospiraceae bacterium]